MWHCQIIRTTQFDFQVTSTQLKLILILSVYVLSSIARPMMLSKQPKEVASSEIEMMALPEQQQQLYDAAIV